MPFFHNHGAELYYEDHGSGRPLLFSHGLGGCLDHVLPLVQGLRDIRAILYDNRTHGRSPDAGEPGTLTFDGMADDAAALLAHLGVRRTVVGGVSMGAGIALALALRHPGMAQAVLLSRPAWLDQPVPPNLAMFLRIADLVERLGREKAWIEFEKSADYAGLARTSPATAQSLAGQFTDRSDAAIVASFRSIPGSAPCRSLSDLRRIEVPVLVIGNHNDPIHPFEFAEALAASFPRASLRTVISKSENLPEHERQFRQALVEFLATLETP